MTMVPLCVECKWLNYTNKPYCTNQNVKNFHDPVNGQETPTCKSERDRAYPENPCGLSGRLFQARGTD